MRTGKNMMGRVLMEVRAMLLSAVHQARICIISIPCRQRSFFLQSLFCHIVLHKLAVSSGCKRPELITSTKLRKHLTTVYVVLTVSDEMQDQLAFFMGHDIRIHRQYYRICTGLVQKAKVLQILMNVNTGDISKYRGKSEDLNMKHRLTLSILTAISPLKCLLPNSL